MKLAHESDPVSSAFVTEKDSTAGYDLHLQRDFAIQLAADTDKQVYDFTANENSFHLRVSSMREDFFFILMKSNWQEGNGYDHNDDDRA